MSTGPLFLGGRRPIELPEDEAEQAEMRAAAEADPDDNGVPESSTEFAIWVVCGVVLWVCVIFSAQLWELL